ncbi:hypothetical protein WMO40_16235 [Bacillaceae bacterium CLA-AA-H227]|uniref:Uncharacterized protein n=1 Tax=Robertmurraya yapensis (ex Hitch et al 2024) TaxID=3133160 RepID=A0ACC6SDW8_9BACI
MKDTLMSVLFITITIYIIWKNRITLMKLTKIQLIGVVLSYLVAIFVVFSLIYFGGNWIAGQFSNVILKYIIFLAIVCIVLYFCGSILQRVLEKITNGVLPKK